MLDEAIFEALQGEPAQKLPFEKWRVRRDTQMCGMRHLLSYQGVRCFPRGDLVAISGKEKCGKTTTCRIITSAILKGSYFGFRALEERLQVLWIDTEQFEVSTRTLVRCIDQMVGKEVEEERLQVFNLRGRDELIDLRQMQQALKEIFNEYKPDLVILDGIRDFIADFNDVEESANIVLQCMSLANGVSVEQAATTGLNQRPPCCIVCLLHQNKPKDDSNMMGHLGSTLAKKAGELWNCTQDDDHVFSFTQEKSRTRPIEKAIQYKVRTETCAYEGEELGIPYLWDAEINDSSSEEPKGPLIGKRNIYLEGFDLKSAFYSIIKEGCQVRSKQLEETFRNRFHLGYIQYSELKERALTEKIIYKLELSKKQVYYTRYEDNHQPF